MYFLPTDQSLGPRLLRPVSCLLLQHAYGHLWPPCDLQIPLPICDMQCTHVPPDQ